VSDLAVDVRDLTRRFGSFVAVDRVSFQIPRGAIFGFLGPNGAGKSTTIRMLLGILPVTSGEGTVLGLDIRTRSEQIRARVGYMSQRFSLYEDLTVRENLDFFGGVFGLSGSGLARRVVEVVELARLEGFQDQMAQGLPGGIRQRLSLAVSLLHDPEIVFLDEPTGAVDPALRRYFWERIAELSSVGRTVMVTSHYMDEVERCHDICFIHQGRIMAQGSPGRLKGQHLPGQMWQVRTDRRAEVAALLGRLPGVSGAFPSGEAVRYLLEPGGNASVPGQALQASGLPCLAPEPVEPTLEDVFVALSRRRGEA